MCPLAHISFVFTFFFVIYVTINLAPPRDIQLTLLLLYILFCMKYRVSYLLHGYRHFVSIVNFLFSINKATDDFSRSSAHFWSDESAS